MTDQYRVYQCLDGGPVAVSPWVDRTTATLTAYALAGIPFVEYFHHGQSLVRSVRGMWVVRPCGEEY